MSISNPKTYAQCKAYSIAFETTDGESVIHGGWGDAWLMMAAVRNDAIGRRWEVTGFLLKEDIYEGSRRLRQYCLPGRESLLPGSRLEVRCPNTRAILQPGPRFGRFVAGMATAAWRCDSVSSQHFWETTMSQLAAGHDLRRSPSSSQVVVACAATILALIALSAGIALSQGVLLPFMGRAAPLGSEINATLKTQGPAAAADQYRALRDKGFASYLESENETNSLGYELLGKGDPADAVTIFKLNAETHPDSANAFDSLGEGEAALGDKQAAIASYRRALALNIHEKSSDIALAKLTGVPRRPFAISTLMHITAGVLGILLGTASMLVRKGGRLHRLFGDGFFISMLVMAGMGGSLAALHGEPANVFGAIFTLYMLLTAWSAGRRRERTVNWLNYGALLVGATITVFGFSMGFKTFADHGFVAPFIGMGITVMIATVLDLRVIMAGGITGSARIARHLWRMSAAFLIAVSSFFLGQPQVMPDFATRTNLVALPSILVIAALLYYLFRVRYWDRRHGRRASFQIDSVAHSPDIVVSG